MRPMLVRKSNKLITKALYIIVVGLVICVWSGIIWAPQSTDAAVKKYLNYQGKLLDSSGIPVSDGNYSIVFSIYNVSAGGANLWTETDTVATRNGLFSIMLGSTTSLILNFEDETDYYLGVKVQADAEMTPRKQIGAAAYSFNTDLLDGLDKTQSGSTSAAIVALTANGNLTVTGDPQGGAVTQGSLYINPDAGDVANEDTLFGVAVGGVEKLLLDEDGDLTVAGYVSTTQLFIDSIDVQTFANRLTSGAYVIGVEPTNIFQSTSTNVQFVLEDISSVLGTVSTSANLWTDAGTYIYNTPAGDKNRFYDNGDVLFDQAGLTFYVSSTANLVGIGTVNPTAKLDVRGTIKLGDAGSYFIGDATHGFRFNNNADSANNVHFYDNAGVAIGTGAGYASNATGPGANNVVIEGNVGIATTTPEAVLNVYGAVNTPLIRGDTNVNRPFGMGLESAGGQYGIAFYVHDGAGLNKQVIIEANGGMIVGNGYMNDTAPTDGMIIEGSVGIGTTSPNYPLHVSGTTIGLFSGSGNDAIVYVGDTEAGGDYGQVRWLAGTSDFSLYGSAGLAISIESGGDIIMSNGNVGIGTSSPGYKLHVAGTAGVTGALAVSSTDLIFDAAGTAYASSTSRLLSGAYYLGVNPTNIFQSTSTNVQFVLEDISSVLRDTSISAQIWTDPGTWIYPTAAGDYGGSGMRIYDDGGVAMDADLVVDGLGAFGTATNSAITLIASTTNETIAIYADNQSAGVNSYGLYSWVHGGATNNYGIAVYATGGGADNYGVIAYGDEAGLYGENYLDSTVYGIIGYQDDITGEEFGGLFASGDDTKADTRYGAYGEATTQGTAYGLYGYASSSSFAYGLYATTDGTGAGWAGWFDQGDVYVTNKLYVSSSELYIGTDTYLSDFAGRLDSGAYFVGVNPTNIFQSTSTNVQFVLEDISSVLRDTSISAQIWTDAGTWVYPTAAGDYGGSGMRIYDDGGVAMDADLVVDGRAGIGAATTSDWQLYIDAPYPGNPPFGVSDQGGIFASSTFSGNSGGMYNFNGLKLSTTWTGTPGFFGDALYGINNAADFNASGQTISTVIGSNNTVTVSSGTASIVYGVSGLATNLIGDFFPVVGGTIDTAYGGYFKAENGSSGTYGLKAEAWNYLAGFMGGMDPTPAGDVYGVVGTTMGEKYSPNSVAYGGTFGAATVASSTYGVYAKADGGTDANYGVYSTVTDPATTNFGIFVTTANGSTNWAGYFASGDVYSADNLYVGSYNETIANPGFTTSGDDLFVAGMAGIEGNVYTDGAFVASTTTMFGESAGYGGYASSSYAFNILPNYDASNYFRFSSIDSQPVQYFVSSTMSNYSGFRLNSSTGEMEYRDDGLAPWTPFDTIAAGASLWTDAGLLTYLTATTDDLVVGDTVSATAPFYIDVSAPASDGILQIQGSTDDGYGINVDYESSGGWAGATAYRGSASSTYTSYVLYGENKSYNVDSMGGEAYGAYMTFTAGGDYQAPRYGYYSNVSGGSSNYGGYFFVNDANATSTNFGVYAYSRGSEIANYGVDSYVNGPNGSVNYGYNTTSTGGATAYGIHADVSNASTNYGGYFQISNTGVATSYGVYATVGGAGGTTYGLYANALGGATNWAGWFDQGDVYVTNKLYVSSSELFIGTDTYLSDFAGREDSGAYFVGVYPNTIPSSNSTNVQFVLEDISNVLEEVSASAGGLWTDSGTYYTYLTSTTSDLVLGAAAPAGAPFYVDVSNPDSDGILQISGTNVNGYGTYVDYWMSDNLTGAATNRGTYTYMNFGGNTNNNHLTMYGEDTYVGFSGTPGTGNEDLYAVHGKAEINSFAGTISNVYGGYFEATQSSFGTTVDKLYGVRGVASSMQSNTAYGGYFEASSGTTDIAIYADAPGGTPSDWAAWFAGGNVYVTNDLFVSSSDLFIGTDTYLSDFAGREDSGAYFVGVNPTNIFQSTSTNVQFVLEDISSVLRDTSISAQIWTDAGTWVYPTAAGDYGGSGMRIYDDGGVALDADLVVDGLVGVGTATSTGYGIRTLGSTAGLYSQLSGDSTVYGYMGYVDGGGDEIGGYFMSGSSAKADMRYGVVATSISQDENYGVYSTGHGWGSGDVFGVYAEAVGEAGNHGELFGIQVLTSGVSYSGASYSRAGDFYSGAVASSSYALDAYAENGTEENIGIKAIAGGTSLNYGVYAQASGGATNWAGYFAAGDVYSADDLLVGATAETLANAGFVLGGDDLFVAGMAGIEGNVYTDGSFIASTTTEFGESASLGGFAKTDAPYFSIVPNNDTSNYFRLAVTDSQPIQYFVSSTMTYYPGFRLSSTTGELEYRDEDSAAYTSFDTIADSALIWTDAGTYVYPTDAGDYGATGMRIWDDGGMALDADLVVDGHAGIGYATDSDAVLKMGDVWTADLTATSYYYGTFSSSTYTGNTQNEKFYLIGDAVSVRFAGTAGTGNEYLFGTVGTAYSDQSSGYVDLVYGGYFLASKPSGSSGIADTLYGVYADANPSSLGKIAYGGYFSAQNATSTNYGVYGTATGAGVNNYAVYATASGGTNDYAFYSPDSGGYSYFGDHVAIAEAIPEANTVLGIQETFTQNLTESTFLAGTSTTINYTGDTGGYLFNFIGNKVVTNFNGTAGNGWQIVTGVSSQVDTRTNVEVLGAAYGFYGDVNVNSLASVTSAYGIYTRVDTNKWGSTSTTTGGYFTAIAHENDTYGSYSWGQGYSESGGTMDNIYGAYNYGLSNNVTVTNVYGTYSKALDSSNATNVYGVYGTASGGTNNWAGYFAAGDVYSADDLYVGATAETLSNAGFSLDGDDFFVAGMAGIEGNVYTDGAFVASTTTVFGEYSAYGGFASSSYAFNILPNDETNDYFKFVSQDNQPVQYFVSSTMTNYPGFRLNSSTGEMEYRDEDSAVYTSFDTIADSATIWTDGGTWVYPTPAGDYGGSGMRIYDDGGVALDADLVVDGLVGVGTATSTGYGIRTLGSTAGLYAQDADDANVYAYLGYGSWGAQIKSGSAAAAAARRGVSVEAYSQDVKYGVEVVAGGYGSGASYGVFGRADGASGNTGNLYGIYGWTTSAIYAADKSAYAGYFLGDAAATTTYGVYASAAQGTTTNYGLYSMSSGGGGANNYGVYAVGAGSGISYGSYAKANGSGTNYAAYATASAGTTNYAFYSPDAGGYSYFGDHVAIEDGTLQDASTTLSVGETYTGAGYAGLELSGVSTTITYTGGAGGNPMAVYGERVDVHWNSTTGDNTQVAYGGYFEAINENAAELDVSRGIYGAAIAKAGTITTAYGVYGEAYESGGTNTDGYGGYFSSVNATTNYGVYGQVVGGTVSHGVYADVAGATTGYGMYSTVSGGSTQYSGYFSATGGAGDTTYGVYSTVSGGDSNYAFYSPDSGGYSYFGDHVAIEDGTAQDAYTVLSVGEVFSSASLVTGYLTGVSTTVSYTGGAIDSNQILVGEKVETRWSGGTGSGNQSAFGGLFTSNLASFNTLEYSAGVYAESQASDGAITNSLGLYGYSHETGGSITTGYGVWGESSDADTNLGIYGLATNGTTNYGIYAAATGGTDYAGYFAEGRVQIEGDGTPTAPGWATTDGSLYVNQRMEVDAGAEFDGTGIAINLSTTVSPNSTYDIRLGSGQVGYVDVYDSSQNTSLAIVNSNGSYRSNLYVENYLGLGTGVFSGPTNEVIYGVETFTGAGDTYDRYGLRMDVETNINDSDMNLYGVYSDVTVASQQIGSLVGTHNEVNLNTYDTNISLNGLRNSVTLDQYGGSTGVNSIYLYGIDSKVLMNNSSSTVDSAYGARIEVDQGAVAGDTGTVYGSFVDLTSKAGDPGNWYGYYLTTTNTPAGNKYAFYSNSDGWDAVFGANLYIGNGSAGDDDYLYFDAGAEYLRYDEVSSDKFEFSGSLGIGEDSGADNDSIYFDAGGESITWDNATGEFYFTDDIKTDTIGIVYANQLKLTQGINTVFNAGGAVHALINVIGDSVGSIDHVNGDEDLWIGDSLEVDGTVWFDGLLTVTGTYYRLYVDSNNRVMKRGSTGDDYAERFWNDGTYTLEAGDLLASSGASSTEVTVTKTLAPYDSRIMGIVSTEPGEEIGTGDTIVALAGRAPTKVITEGGNIEVGDPIAASSIAGAGMKAVKPGMIVGFALESYSNASSTEISQVEVFVSPSWHSGNAISNDGTLSTFQDNFAFEKAGTASSSTRAFDSYGLSFRGSGWNSASSSAELFEMSMRNAVSSTAEFEYGLEFTNNDGAAVAYINQDGDMMLSGRLYPSNKGAMQRDRYIYLDKNEVFGDYMRTNADGWATGSYDYAEMFPSEQELEPGELVTTAMLDEHVKKSSQAYEVGIIGIVSTKPGFIAGQFTTSTYPIALAGRVPTRVSNEGGAIEIGDPITTSDIPGFGMKAGSSGPIVGYALEAMDAEFDTIIVYVNPGWYGGFGSVAAPGTSNGASEFDPNNPEDITYLSNHLVMNGYEIHQVGAIYGENYKWQIDRNGQLIANIETSQGGKDMFGVISTGAQIVLSGTASLEQGQARLEFSQTVKEIISHDQPIQVTVTLTSGEASGVYVSNKSWEGFTVKELGDGASNAAFDWMVIAQRAGYEVETGGDAVIIDSDDVVETEDSSSTDEIVDDGSDASSTDEIVEGGDGSSGTDEIM